MRLIIQLLAVAPAAPAAPAAVPPVAVELHWAAPAECPTEETIRDEIDRRLSGLPSTEQRVIADARVRQVPEGLELELHLHNASHDDPVRRYVRTSCRDLADMAVDEMASVFPTSRAREVEPAPSPAPAPHPAAKPERTLDTARPPREISGTVRLGGMVGGQRSDREWAVLGGPLVGLGLRGRRWRLEVAATFLQTGELSYSVREDLPSIRVAWRVVTGQLTACGTPVAHNRLELHLCGGGEIGAIFGKLSKTTQVVDVERSSLPWLALHAGPMLSIRLHRNLHLWASGTAAVAFPGNFDVDVAKPDTAIPTSRVDLGTPWLQLRGALGMEIRWGR